MLEKKQPFKALSKICLNNWHYIDRKILSFSEGVNCSMRIQMAGDSLTRRPRMIRTAH